MAARGKAQEQKNHDGTLHWKIPVLARPKYSILETKIYNLGQTAAQKKPPRPEDRGGFLSYDLDTFPPRLGAQLRPRFSLSACRYAGFRTVLPAAK